MSRCKITLQKRLDAPYPSTDYLCENACRRWKRQTAKERKRKSQKLSQKWLCCNLCNKLRDVQQCTESHGFSFTFLPFSFSEHPRIAGHEWTGMPETDRREMGRERSGGKSERESQKPILLLLRIWNLWARDFIKLFSPLNFRAISARLRVPHRPPSPEFTHKYFMCW